MLRLELPGINLRRKLLTYRAFLIRSQTALYFLSDRSLFPGFPADYGNVRGEQAAASGVEYGRSVQFHGAI
jgi:hypothetical protein